MELAKAWDKEESRVLAKDFRDIKTWFFIALEAVAHLASFEEMDAVIREDEIVFGPLHRPDKKRTAFYFSHL